MEKTCSKCGAVFTCKNETNGCWCEQLHISKENLGYLQEHYQNCLCRNCLDKFSQEKQGVEIENQ